MDQDSGTKRSDGGGGGAGNALVLLVTLLAGALIVRQLPLSDSRPPTSEPKAYEYSAPASVDARLWQDPIGAVARGIKGRQQPPPNGAGALERNSIVTAKQVTEWAHDGTKPKPIVVGVMIPGGSYSGYDEWRRKARYAVLSGLKEMGFTPDDPEHLNYFMLDSDLRKSLYRRDEATATRTPQSQFFAYEWFDFAKGGLRSPSGASIADADAGDRRLLLIWLDQDFFWEDTLDRIDGLFSYLLQQPPAPKSKAASEQKPSVIILGPGDSTMLRRMAKQAAAKQAASNPQQMPEFDVSFYDYAATAPDADLLPAPDTGTKPTSIHALFAGRHLTVFRTIGDDETLACALREELILRRIGPPIPPDPSVTSPDIVLISELDTDYGRGLAEITKSVLAGATPCPPEIAAPGDEADQYAQAWSGKHWIGTYTYLRGLDGRLPGRQSEGTDSASGTKSAAKTRFRST